MFSFLNKTERLSGTMLVDGVESGECRYEFSFNPYAPNEMRVVIYEWEDGKLSTWDGQELVLQSGDEDDRTRLTINAELAAYVSETYRFPVLEFVRTERYFENAVPALCSISYNFPLTGVTDHLRMTVSHAAYGFVRGSFDQERNVFVPNDTHFVAPFLSGEIKIGDEFDKHEGEKGLYTEHRLIRRSVASYHSDVEPVSIDTFRDTVREEVNRLMEVISLVERDRLDWHTERIWVTSADGRPIENTHTIRWSPPPSKGYRPSPKGSHRDRSTVQAVFAAYSNASPDVATVVSKTIKNFKVANTAATIESGFASWHSVLDFFITRHQQTLSDMRVRTKPFGRALVHLLDLKGIQYDDLLDAGAVEGAKLITNPRTDVRHRPFRFTQLRNEFFHEGFDAFENDVQEAIRLRRVMRALAERLLLAELGLSHDGLTIGEVGLP